MHTTRKIFTLATSVAVALAVGGFSAAPAFADETPSRGHVMVNAALVGSMPAPVSPVIAGVKPGAAPWVNERSRVRVRDNGTITVRIRGLVIPPPRGTSANPIPLVVATLVCDQQVEASSAPFALSTAGNGSTHAVIATPRHCEDPVVLIQPAANRAIYIASTVKHEQSHTRRDH